MKQLAWIFAIALTLSLSAACGDDGGNNGTPDAADTPDSMPPVNMMPALSDTVIDRAGRPAVATALQETFNPDDMARNTAKDAYNEDGNVAEWANNYTGAVVPNSLGTGFVGSLSVIEALNQALIADGVHVECGDHPLFDFGGAPGFTALAGLLADDRLYVDSSTDTCNTYLGVELAALGLGAPGDCGGRKLEYDVIDVSYSALSLGATSGVTDGIDAPMDEYSETFPFLGDPN